MPLRLDQKIAFLNGKMVHANTQLKDRTFDQTPDRNFNQFQSIRLVPSGSTAE